MATMIQVENSSALESLGLKDAGPTGPPGSPQQLKVTQATVQKIGALVGHTVTVDGSGKVEVQ